MMVLEAPPRDDAATCSCTATTRFSNATSPRLTDVG